MRGFCISRLRGFALLILILQITIYFVVYWNISFARMFFGFVYLLFIPGFIILEVLALKNFDVYEKVLFSVGLSIAFLMFIGLAINEIGKLATPTPLSLNSLVLVISATLLLLAFIHNLCCESNMPKIERPEISGCLFCLLISICLLFLGSYGIFLVNLSGNNLFILALVPAISLAFSLVFLKERLIPPRYYPLLSFVVFFCSLLFLSNAGYVLVTKYVIGSGDQWFEHYTFRLTDHYWDSTLYIPNLSIGSSYSMMSVTILPTIFSIFTDIDSSLLFKLLYPIVASFTAIGVYKLYRTQIDDKTAFLATFFFIAVSAFKGMGPAKQQIAELFYCLLFLLLLKKDIPHFKRAVLLIIFGAALVLSHYSLSYLFLFIFVSFVLILMVLEWQKGGHIQRIKSFLFFTLLFSTITFSWHIFLNKSVIFSKLCESFGMVLDDLDQFFNPASRGTALQGLGFVEAPTILHRISAGLFLLTEALLVLGFIKLLKDRRSSFFSVEYKILACINMGIIAVNILLPRMADTFLMERFYQTSLIILAPLTVVGGRAVLEFLLRQHLRRFYIVLLVFLVFIPFFMFQSEFVFELAGAQHWSVALIKHRSSQVELYRKFGCIDDYYFYGARWLSKNIPSVFPRLYADDLARRTELRGYTEIYVGYLNRLSNVTQLKPGDFVYLNPSNTIGETIIGQRYIWNISDLHFLHDSNKIYSNGGSEVYKNAP